MYFSAADARALTEKNLKGPAIDPYVKLLTEQIQRVAERGRSGFDPWLYIANVTRSLPTEAQKEAIRKHFEGLGFTWKDHPNPDPGNLLARPYTTLSW